MEIRILRSSHGWGWRFSGAPMGVEDPEICLRSTHGCWRYRDGSEEHPWVEMGILWSTHECWRSRDGSEEHPWVEM